MLGIKTTFLESSRLNLSTRFVTLLLILYDALKEVYFMCVILVSGIYLSKTATSAVCSNWLLLDSSRCLTDSGGFLVDSAKFWLFRVINLN